MSNWGIINPVLAAGELGFETNTLKFKMGDGITAWRNLPYCNDFDAVKLKVIKVSQLPQPSQETCNKLYAVLPSSAPTPQFTRILTDEYDGVNEIYYNSTPIELSHTQTITVKCETPARYIVILNSQLSFVRQGQGEVTYYTDSDNTIIYIGVGGYEPEYLEYSISDSESADDDIINCSDIYVTINAESDADLEAYGGRYYHWEKINQDRDVAKISDVPVLVHITQEEYDALSNADKLNGSWYFIEE